MKLLSALLFVLFNQACFSATWYISTNGNDQHGNGSINDPWQTLYKATSTVTKPGDIIHVMEGIYVEKARSILAVGVSKEGDGVASVEGAKLFGRLLEFFGHPQGQRVGDPPRHVTGDEVADAIS